MKKIDLSNKNIIWKIFLAVFAYMILVVGSPIAKQPKLLYIIINIFFILTLVFLCKKKQKISITKIDLLVGIIVLTTFLPLIFQTRISVENTINGIIKYLTLLQLYGISKALLKDNNKIDIIKNLIIILSVIIIIFGIDTMTFNFFDFIYKAIDKVKISNSSAIRMDSLYEYPNTFALIISVAYIFTLEKICKKTSKNTLFNICCFMQIFAIVASGSRLVLLLSIMFTVLYLFAQRKKYRIEEIILQLIVITIISIIYYTIYSGLISQNNNWLIWITFIITNVIIFLLTYIYNKVTKNKVVNYKKILYIIYGIILVFVISVIIDLVVNTELAVFKNSNSESKVIRKIYNIEQNEKYKFEFDVDAETLETKNENFKINVRLYNKEEKEIQKNEMNFNSFKGIKEIEVNTTEDTEYISILFECRNIEKSKFFKVKSCKMNDKTIALNYRIIPYNIIERLNNMSTDSKSVYERICYIKDSFKLIQRQWLLGQGENTWRLMYYEVRSFEYGAVRLHCFPTNLWVQFGIVAFIAYIYIIGLIIKKLIENLKGDKEQISILFAILIIFLHSIVDFDMDFVSILYLYFILIAIADGDSKKIFSININIVKKIILYLITGILLVINIGDFVTQKLDNVKLDKIEDIEEKKNFAKAKTIISPFKYSYKIDYAKILEAYRVLNRDKKDSEEYRNAVEETRKNAEYVINNEYLRNRNEVESILKNCDAEDVD